MKVEDIKPRELFALSPDDDLVKAAQAMKRHNVGAMPVVQDDRLLGIVTDRDICVEAVAAGCDPHQCKVRDFMTAEPVTICPPATLEEAAELMARYQVRRLPVVDQGRLVGIISLGDLAVNLTDDKLAADLCRKVSLPVRSEVPIGLARSQPLAA